MGGKETVAEEEEEKPGTEGMIRFNRIYGREDEPVIVRQQPHQQRHKRQENGKQVRLIGRTKNGGQNRFMVVLGQFWTKIKL